VWAIFAAAHNKSTDEAFLDKLDSFPDSVIKNIANLSRHGQVSGYPDEPFARTQAVEALGLLGITIDALPSAAPGRNPRSK
jgi:hypothetical protein